MAIDIPIISKFNDKGVKDASKQLADFGKKAAQIAAGAAAAVTAIGVASVKAFADFDAELTKSLAIMGNVSDALREDMSDAAREVAKTTTFSANQAAESYFFLASAGLDAAASIQAMPKVAAFAQAGMFDMALATDLLTDAQSALGLSIRDDAIKNMENMVRVSDVLVKANTLANASVEQFSVALTTKAGAALRNLNKDVEEGVAVLAAFADQGIKGETAGTQLSIVLRDLTTKAIQNKREFDRQNVSVFDSAGNMRNMADIVGDLEGALDGMSDETAKATLLQMGFSDKSLASLMALMGTSDAIRTYEESLREAGGTTEEVAGKQLDTLNAQLELMKSRVQDAGIEIGQRLEPAIVAMAEQMGPVIDELVPVFVQLFEELLPVITQLAEEMPAFVEGLAPLIPIIGDLAELVFSIALAAMPALEEVIAGLQPIIEGFTGIMAEHGEIVGAVIVAIGLMVVVVRIATTAMGFYAVATGTATTTSSTFFGVLSKNPVAAFAILILGGAVALYTFRDSVRESSAAGEAFMEAWARVTFGIQWLTKTMVNGALGTLELLHTGIRMVVEAVTNDIRKLGGLPPITLPELKLPRLDVTPLDEYRADLGLLKGEFDDMKFPTVDTTGITDQGRRQLMSASEQRALGLMGGGFEVPEMLRAPSGGMPSGFFTDQQGGMQFRATTQQSTQNTFNVNVNAGMGVNGQRVGDDILSVIQQYEREVGPVFERVRYTG